MDNDHQLKNLNERIAYSWILPIVFLTTAVWFTKDSLAIVIAHMFQLVCCLFLFFISGYVFSLMKRKPLLEFKPFMLFLALTIIIIALLSLYISYFINPGWGMGSMLIGVLILSKYPIPIELNHKFPSWYSGLIGRITVMLCICIMVMLAYWLNPYSEPLKLYKL
jgi:hypothetical protein